MSSVIRAAGHVYYLKGSALPKVFINSPEFLRIWPSDMNVHNGLTFWLERPDNIVAGKQDCAKGVSVYEFVRFKKNIFGV